MTMDCQVEANPANLTDLEWLKNGVVVEGERFIVEDTVLTIIDVEREDAGDYRYQISTGVSTLFCLNSHFTYFRCRARNSVGEGLSEGLHPLVVFCEFVYVLFMIGHFGKLIFI